MADICEHCAYYDYNEEFDDIMWGVFGFFGKHLIGDLPSQAVQVLFQLCNILTYSRLRHTKLCSSLGEAALLSHLHDPFGAEAELF